LQARASVQTYFKLVQVFRHTSSSCKCSDILQARASVQTYFKLVQVFRGWGFGGARGQRNVREQDIWGNANEGVAALRRCAEFSQITQQSGIAASPRPSKAPPSEHQKRRVDRARGVRGTVDAAREEDELCGIAALPHASQLLPVGLD
ncbi:hypothetical protein, partial [Halodesulfovibrio sp.]|uniref:hypothetical protein n=1 Tax=Halodesulfovibrio sp. TaxID=1912772 RepID=UPI0025E6CB71